MSELLTNLPVGSVGAGTLLVLVVLLILNGRLVPRQHLLDMREDRDQWRASSENWQRSATQLSLSVDKLMVLAETTNHALTEIQTIAQRDKDSER